MAAEYGNLEAAALLLDRGADVNARATVDEAGVGGQTAIFHAVTQFDDGGLPVTQLLIERGADLVGPREASGSLRAAGRGRGVHRLGIRPAVWRHKPEEER